MNLTTFFAALVSLATTALAVPSNPNVPVVPQLTVETSPNGQSAELNQGGLWGGADTVVSWDNNKHIRLFTINNVGDASKAPNPLSGRIGEYKYDEGKGWSAPTDIGARASYAHPISALAAADGSKVTVFYVDRMDHYIKSRVWIEAREEKGWIAGEILPGMDKGFDITTIIPDRITP